MAYEPLTQLVTEENPYGDIVTSAMIDAAVAAVKAELTALRAGLKAPDDLRLVDGPAAKNFQNATIQNPVTLEYDALMRGLFWYFKGKPVRVSKGIKLEYPIGPGRTYSILIGFEGSGGGM